VFTGAVARIAPIFRESSRQARVEVSLPNPDHPLKPGMFARCTLELDRVDDAIIVPDLAITERDGQSGVFRVAGDGASVNWVPVETGLRDGDRVQLLHADLSGRVVTLGQQLVEDGSIIHIPANPPAPAGGAAAP
jgi:multidrug efflux pump subunit AcrA (membrane-fusion protein)